MSTNYSHINVNVNAREDEEEEDAQRTPVNESSRNEINVRKRQSKSGKCLNTNTKSSNDGFWCAACRFDGEFRTIIENNCRLVCVRVTGAHCLSQAYYRPVSGEQRRTDYFSGFIINVCAIRALTSNGNRFLNAYLRWFGLIIFKFRKHCKAFISSVSSVYSLPSHCRCHRMHSSDEH